MENQQTLARDQKWKTQWDNLDTRILLTRKTELNNAVGEQQRWTGTFCNTDEVNQRERNIIRYHLQEESINLYQWTTIQNRKRLTNFENQLTIINNKKKLGRRGKVRLLHYHIHTHIYPIDNHKEHTELHRERSLNTLFRARIDIHLDTSESSSWTPKTAQWKSALFNI